MFSFKSIPRSLVGSALAVLLASPATAQTNLPNILFFLTEDAGAFDSVIGKAGVQTPGLESIANRGVYFSNAHVAAPVCSVSKAALMTGLMPHSNNLRTNVQNYYPGAQGIPAGDIPHGDPAGVIPQMIAADQNSSLNSQFRIHDEATTLIEVLKNEGYYTGVTHKLHVSGVDRFQYDHWIAGDDPTALNKVANGAAAQGEPFFLLYNIPDPHRPYTNSDNNPITVDPNDVVVPGQFVDTPTARQDWAEHLDGVEAADAKVVDALNRLDNLGLTDDTIVVFMSDHGPSWHRGKQSTYDFGSRVSLAITGPGVAAGGINDTVVNEIDLMPTLLDMIGVSNQPNVQGQSIAPILQGTASAPDEPKYSVTEVQHMVRITDNGQNEKKITDGQYSLIFRFNHTGDREFNADQHISGNPWRNRIYYETIAVYDDLQANPGNYTPRQADRINRAYRLLDEMDTNPTRNYDLFVNAEIELFHNTVDPYELNNVVDDPSQAETRDRLLSALYAWTIKTNDTYVDARLIPAPGVTGDHFEGGVSGSNLGNDLLWSTPLPGNAGADFTFNGDGTIDAPPGGRALATFTDEVLGAGESFLGAIDVNFTAAGVGAGLVFGYEDSANFYEFQLLDGDSGVGGADKDIRLVEVQDGVESIPLFVNSLDNIDRNEAYRLIVEYDALASTAELMVVNEHGIPYFSQDFVLPTRLAAGSHWGISTWSSSSTEFGRFDLQVTSTGDFDSDGIIDGLDFLAWQRGESPNPFSSEDLEVWSMNYGTNGTLTAVASVPEPTASGLFIAACCSGLLLRNRPC